jgi:putative transposase
MPCLCAQVPSLTLLLLWLWIASPFSTLHQLWVYSTLKQYDIVCSISRKANYWNNAVMERFYHSLKAQVYYADYQTPNEARKDIFDYIEMFCNGCRAYSYLGYVSRPMNIKVFSKC